MLRATDATDHICTLTSAGVIWGPLPLTLPASALLHLLTVLK